MATETQVALEEYLSTVYEPDCDYVDGELEDRNVGEFDHGDLQSEIVHYFRTRRREFSLRAIGEWRTRVSPTRYRVPDVTLIREPFVKERVLTQPAYVCIEILSPEDRWSRLNHKLNDYVKAGVENIWVIDPAERIAWTFDELGAHQLSGTTLTTKDGNIALPLAEIFAELD